MLTDSLDGGHNLATFQCIITIYFILLKCVLSLGTSLLLDVFTCQVNKWLLKIKNKKMLFMTP